ncbi:phage tail tape measure protein [Paenibacillus larvae]|nr:phage tail tape measure protein [Paenibacillus larvae]MDT2306582.1 phage tail tape measure protein [Paenibacillus larvae]
MSEQMPRSATQLAEIAEAGGQLGVKAKDLKLIKTIAMIADTTNIAQEQASMDFARIANIMELPIPKLENLASSVVWLGNNFATTETEILDFPHADCRCWACVGYSCRKDHGLVRALQALVFAPRLEAQHSARS